MIFQETTSSFRMDLEGQIAHAQQSAEFYGDWAVYWIRNSSNSSITYDNYVDTQTIENAILAFRFAKLVQFLQERRHGLIPEVVGDIVRGGTQIASK